VTMLRARTFSLLRFAEQIALGVVLNILAMSCTMWWITDVVMGLVVRGVASNR